LKVKRRTERFTPIHANPRRNDQSRLVTFLHPRSEKASAFGRTVTVKVKFADFRQVTRSRSLPTEMARHDLLRRTSIELVRTLLPTAIGIRLLGVTVSNFDQASAKVDELPLFLAREAIVSQPGAAPSVAAAGGH
jgi:nucleotidyltransferase/DNA polymerase involved in DNA repair